MTLSPVEQIKRNQNRRHDNTDTVARCHHCGSFLNKDIPHQACPNSSCGIAVFILNGMVVDREPRPGTV